jgi:Fe-S-cluster containining protein
LQNLNCAPVYAKAPFVVEGLVMAALLIFLMLGLLVFGLVVAGVCYEVVFHGDRIFAEREQEAAAWRPPFARGEELLRWARETTARLVGRRLAQGRTASTPAKLAADLHAGATQAMLPLSSQWEAKGTVACPEEGQGMVGVTAPEVIEIADYLRRNFPKAEWQRIHDLACQNALRLAPLDQARFDEAQTLCPLQGADHVCCVYEARPLRCRPLHAAIIANQLGLSTAGANGEIPPWAAHVQTVEQGVEEGFVRGLEQAGLDAELYELNSALATALETPDAGQRWMRGENVFAGCQPYR